MNAEKTCSLRGDKMVNLEEAKKIVLQKHPEEWIYQVAELAECYQFWLLPKREKWYPTTFVVDTPIVDKQTGKLNDEGTMLDTDLNNGVLHWYDYRHSND